MLKTRLALLSLALLVAVAGCGGAEFAQEKTVLDALTKGMETLTSAVNGADTPAALTDALGSFSGVLEKFLPQMKKMTAEHADWETDPPEELEDTFAKFNQAKSGFQSIMPKITSMAQANLDNADLQNAVSKFTSLLKDM